jgi:NAD-dependent SIR2 family protein deacetylase
MGQDGSVPAIEDKYQEFITGLKEGKFKNICFITGAGISTSAGIPDFRSKTGLFAQTQKKYNLSSPEAFFQINSFYRHPEHFYDFCKGFNIDHCKPTKTHLFMGFLIQKQMLLKIYTQNVDGLELKAGIPKNKVVFAHGTITEAHCPNCNKYVDIEELRKYVMDDKIMYCEKCKVPCKPKVVFYGENLPGSFYKQFNYIYESDLTFIMGTSLKVMPFGRLPYEVPKLAWRVLINKEKVGTVLTYNRFKFDDNTKRDLFISGYTDEIVARIVKDCEWEEEFEAYTKQYV